MTKPATPVDRLRSTDERPSSPRDRPSSPPERKTAKDLRARSRWQTTAIGVSLLAVLGVYLFVQAPPPLAATTAPPGTVPIRAVFALLAAENDAARALWTEDIVQRGTAAGLAFDERWKDEAVHAGPLPALFLRETARGLERSPLRLRLFLGSRYPISAANAFTGDQAAQLARLEETGAPQVFADPSTGMQTAMFADRAVVDACVRCHNEHASSPKTDWKLGDIMGATTWMYPEETVTVERAVELIATYRTSARAAYAAFLAEVATWPTPPAIGEGWPKDGAHLPSEDVFMAELARRASSTTLAGLLDPARAADLTVTPPAPPPPPRVQAATTPATAPDLLVIRTTRSTRVTVEHAGSRLMVVRLKAGATASLSAPPPLRVQLSDPQGVTLEYRGQPVPMPAEPATSSDDGDVEITVGGPLAEKS